MIEYTSIWIKHFIVCPGFWETSGSVPQIQTGHNQGGFLGDYHIVDNPWLSQLQVTDCLLKWTCMPFPFHCSKCMESLVTWSILRSFHAYIEALSALKSRHEVVNTICFFPPKYWRMSLAGHVFQQDQHGSYAVDASVVPVFFCYPKQIVKRKAQTWSRQSVGPGQFKYDIEMLHYGSFLVPFFLRYWMLCYLLSCICFRLPSKFGNLTNLMSDG